ncbi:hypothetical protein CDAR_618841 [Caerostris darwini]|uniref:Uncharacterized protein n=1 Tax=Caerostris darwini TaxID=1538125 RepID=A0AAV4R218_9ARAC|nr:hypothetical protein CDAR_618841 [Caerostris darwini]
MGTCESLNKRSATEKKFLYENLRTPSSIQNIFEKKNQTMVPVENSPFMSLVFADNFGKYLAKLYNVTLPCLSCLHPYVDLLSVLETFRTEIGYASTSTITVRQLLDERFSTGFDINYFWFEVGNVRAMLYVKEHARRMNLLNQSFFLLCAFIGQICLLSAIEGHSHLVQLPLLALSDILYEKKLLNTLTKRNNIYKADSFYKNFTNVNNQSPSNSSLVMHSSQFSSTPIT